MLEKLAGHRPFVVAPLSQWIYTLTSPDAETHPCNASSHTSLLILFLCLELLGISLAETESLVAHYHARNCAHYIHYHLYPRTAQTTCLIRLCRFYELYRLELWSCILDRSPWSQLGIFCLDVVTHMAEEIPDPRLGIPKALIGTTHGYYFDFLSAECRTCLGFFLQIFDYTSSIQHTLLGSRLFVLFRRVTGVLGSRFRRGTQHLHQRYPTFSSMSLTLSASSVYSSVAAHLSPTVHSGRANWGCFVASLMLSGG